MNSLPVPHKAAIKIEGTKVLVIAPYPDDEVFGCGGAIMRHVAAGDSLQVIILCDDTDRAESKLHTACAELRRTESTQAAKILGYREPEFWGLLDSNIEYGEFLIRRIQRVIEIFQIDLIYAPSIYELRLNYRTVGMAAVEAVRRIDSKLKLAMYEVGVPILRPNLFLDISDLCERKQQAMACFTSQLREQPYNEQIAALNKSRTYTLGSHVSAAEAYFVIDAGEMDTGILKLHEFEHQRLQDFGVPIASLDIPLVSVLVRSMNRTTLNAALNSVALQTYPHIEVVVINAKGGEHTSLGDWCGRFPIRLINKSEPCQRSRAANLALKEAIGQYMIFLDDDDWFAPHHIASLVERIRQEPGVNAVYSNVRVVGAKGNFENHVFKEKIDPIRMMADNLIPIHSVLFDRSLINAGCLFDETLLVYEDWDFWLQVSRHTAFSHIDEVGAYYCSSGNSEVGLRGIDDARKRAREVVFEKWKNIWSGRDINALLAHKDFLTATKAHEMEFALGLQKDQALTVQTLEKKLDTNTREMAFALRIQKNQALTVQTLEEKLNTSAQDFQERLMHQAEALSRQQDLSESLKLSLIESQLQVAELIRQLNALAVSKSWREADSIQWAGTRVRSVKYVLKLGRKFAQENGGGSMGVWRLGFKSFTALIKYGPFGLTDKIRMYAKKTLADRESTNHLQINDAKISFSTLNQGVQNLSGIPVNNMPFTHSSTYLLKTLFHSLPFSKDTKNKIQDYCYQKFPNLFSSLPSYKFWLLRGTTHAPNFSDKINSAAKHAEWSMMLPVTDVTSNTQTISVAEIDVVVPVYRGLAQTRRCIDSVLDSTSMTPFRLILINDASPETEVSDYLRSLRSTPRVILVENSENLGFTATVNLGMSLSDANDVVLLNNDTEVANDWLDRLSMHAYSADKVGTVTPFSSNATICNYPTLAGMKELPDEETTQSLDAAFAFANRARNIEIPTAIGFCMYIRRDCLIEVGLFDVETFGKGYGEENDFCLRASVLGWSHLLAADTFVFHEGEVSFQAGSNSRKERAMQILRDRYPYYEAVVAEHVTLNEAYPLRIAATAARFKNNALPVVLHILHSHGGGTEKHVEELCLSHIGKAKLLIMNAPLESGKNSRLRLRSAAPSDGLDLLVPASNMQFLAALCQSFGIARIHIHHVLDYPFDLRMLVQALGIPFYLTIHDYFLICPRINLMPLNQKYCGEPAPSKCNQCLAPDTPHGGSDIIWWRANHAWLFEDATMVICPSQDVETRCKRYHPDATYRVIGHESISNQIFDVVMAPSMTKDEPLRVAILGVLAKHKGLNLISEALVIANSADSPLECRLIGFAEEKMPQFDSRLFTQTGHYKDSELLKLIENFNPHLIIFPACWPETYSYTLTVALNSGRPIMATNIGAFPERVASRPWTWLIDWNISSSQLVQKLESIRDSNFLTGTPPLPPKTDLLTCATGNGTANFYANEYFSVKRDIRSLQTEIVDIRKNATITAMVLVENVGVMPSPCAYIRLILPLTPEHGNALNLRWVTDIDVCHYKSDVLIIQRTAVTSISTISVIVAHCRKNDIRIVYDLDDFLLALPEDHPEHLVYAPKSAAVSRWLAEANEVWVSTDALRLQVAEICTRVRVVPNHLDELLWVKPVITPAQRDPARIVRLLYMGTQTHLADFELVKNALYKLKKEFSTEIEICLIGITTEETSDRWYKFLRPPHTVGSNYPAFVNWIINTQDFDIGITPLVDNQFNRCKSAIKFLDYSALGMVTVASDIGVYTPIRQGENGFLVENTEAAWFQTLKTLVADSTLRRRLQFTAQSEVFEFHGYERVRGLRVNLLRNLLAESGATAPITHEFSGQPQAAELI